MYVNKYYEKNITTTTVTSYYYLGDRLVALKKGTTLEYVHQAGSGTEPKGPSCPVTERRLSLGFPLYGIPQRGKR